MLAFWDLGSVSALLAVRSPRSPARIVVDARDVRTWERVGVCSMMWLVSFRAHDPHTATELVTFTGLDD